VFHGLYASTFARHGNYAALSPRFFERLGALLGTQILLVEALRGQDVIAAAFFLEGSDSLYGRYWGATESVPDLHFELCYYQGIEHAIEKGFSSFEPGAQGEHKISRGFLPEKTHSYHWIEHLGFREAIERHVVHENRKMIEYMTACANHSPYRESAC
jgi:predicted N-acyltransferase